MLQPTSTASGSIQVIMKNMMQANGRNGHRMFKGSFSLERTQTLLQQGKGIKEDLISIQSP